MFLNVAFVVAFALCAHADIATLQHGIPHLTSKNFTQFVNSNVELVFVLFYAPWCGHSKMWLPKFERAVEVMNSNSVPAYSVDCVEETSLYWEHKIKGYPTTIAFLRGEPMIFEGENEINPLLLFAQRLSTPAVKATTDLEAFTSSTVTDTQAAAVLTTSNTTLLKHFDTACKKLPQESFPCASRLDHSLAPSSSLLQVYRNYEHEEAVVEATGTWLHTSSSIVSFISSRAAYPRLIPFKARYEDMMFAKREGYNIHVLIAINSKAGPNADASLAAARAVTSQEEFVGKCIFAHVDGSDTDSYVTNILEDVQIEVEEMPTVMLIQSAQTEVKFFRLPQIFTGVLDEQIFSHWLRDFFTSKLTPSRVSRMPVSSE